MTNYVKKIFLIASFSIACQTANGQSIPVDQKACLKRVAVVPPKTNDVAFARQIITLASKKMSSIYKTRLCKDFELVALDLAFEAFDTIGMNSFFSKASWELTANQLSFIHAKLDVTHLAFLEDISSTTMRVAVYPLIQRQQDDTFKIGDEIVANSSPMINISAVKSTPDWARLASLMSPNSFTLGFTTTQVGFDGPAGFDEIETKIKSKLPPIISAFSIETIEHPVGFQSFDYVGSLFPGFFGYAVDQSTTYKYGEGIDPATWTYGEVSVKTLGMCPHVTGQISLFSPLGTTHLGLGAAACVAVRQSMNHRPAVFGAPALRYAVGHRVFVSEKLYVFFSSEVVLLKNAYFYRDAEIKSQMVTRAIFGLGYFLPNNQSRVSEILGFR